MAKVSIIVPVYNAEKYLERCIESILTQTYEDFECILVDDGSKDGSLLICNKYRQQDMRINVIHKDNTGVSSARNIGIQNASGEYLTFVDSDDELTSSAISDMIEVAETTNCNLVVSDVKRIANNEVKIRKRNVYGKFLYDSEESLSFILGGMIDTFQMRSVWGKLFKTNLIKEYNIQFDEGRPLFEDGVFLLEYIKVAKDIVSIASVVYVYYDNDGSASNSYNQCCNEYVLDVIHRVKGMIINRKSNILLERYTDIVINDFMYLMYYYTLRSPNRHERIKNIKQTCLMFENEINYLKLSEKVGKKYTILLNNKEYKKFIKEYRNDLGYTLINSLKLKIKRFSNLIRGYRNEKENIIHK